MLACCNAARLWRDTCINVDVLEKNVMCITFGQPLLAIPYVQETVTNYTKFESTIHSIYDHEDIFPKLFRNKYGQLQGEQALPLKALTNGGSISEISQFKVGQTIVASYVLTNANFNTDVWRHFISCKFSS